MGVGAGDAVGAGDGSAIDPAVVSQLVGMRRDKDPLSELTPREREVLELMAEGRPNQRIAGRLVITDHALEKHISNILQKLCIEAGPDDRWRVLAVLTFLRFPRAPTRAARPERTYEEGGSNPSLPAQSS